MTSSPDDRTARVDDTEAFPRDTSASSSASSTQASEASTDAEKPAPKKSAPKKAAAKKATAKKPTATESAAKKPAAKKSTATKTTTARTSGTTPTKTSTTKADTTKTSAAKKPATSKTAAKTSVKAPAKSTTTKAAAEKAAPTAEVVVEPLPKAMDEQPAKTTSTARTAADARKAAAKNTASRAAATKSSGSTAASDRAAAVRVAAPRAAVTGAKAAAPKAAGKTPATKSTAAKTAAAKTAAAKSAATKSTARAATAKTAAAKTTAAKKSAAARAAAAKAKAEADDVKAAQTDAALVIEDSPVTESAPATESAPSSELESAPEAESATTDASVAAVPAVDDQEAPGAESGEGGAEQTLVAEADAADEVTTLEVVEAVADSDDAVADAPGRTDATSAGEAVSVRGLVKQFGDNRAVGGIDLSVPAGSFYGVVGPNGAGKTTTLSIVAGLLRADEGSVTICGVDQAAQPQAAKRLMGVLPDRLRTFDRLTGRQLLYYYGLLRGLSADVIEKRAADLARAFDLGDALSRVVSDYSAGMTKKIMLAGAMIHSPRVLVLDEPFESVDPVSSAVILDILRAYVSHGGTVILSSHGMDLVERVCSRVAIIVGGEVLAEGTIDEVRAGQTLEARFVELAGSSGEVEGLEWLHTFSD
ncbi:ABC transporter ATP-binding protein [Microbacterium sp. KSW4-16]|uniref:ABC transporter ATP-binding protein n=1 Tax=Microbacterium TaxID=33882 RepID=UPI001F0FD5C3|nr:MULTISPECIES: ABC transporter ATP-binding protein [Microbacterium]MCK8468107.1 ABC transporter ATP-binding protein [Microbacterium aurugineum]